MSVGAAPGSPARADSMTPGAPPGSTETGSAGAASQALPAPDLRPKILFLHPVFGAQFEFFGTWLARNGWDVAYAYSGDDPDNPPQGIRLYRFRQYDPPPGPSTFLSPLQTACANASATAQLFNRLRYADGYIPDVVISHIGWGVGLCVKQIWPETYYICYCEWYYGGYDWAAGRQADPRTLLNHIGDRMSNLPVSAEFDTSDANWSPTAFQASRFPPHLRQRLDVVPDGVNTRFYCPDPQAELEFDWLDLRGVRNILTYATRGMEPIRGFPQFMAGLALLQKRRNDFHTVILANESVSYGNKLPDGDTWRLRMLNGLDLDQSRLHVFGMRRREEYLRVLQVSSAHVYFTEPFVTSWSLTEALGAGCLVIGSRTAPVQEMITDEETGILVDMDDPEEIADMIEWAFDYPEAAAELRRNARQSIIDRFDSERVFAEKSALLRRLIGR